MPQPMTIPGTRAPALLHPLVVGGFVVVMALMMMMMSVMTIVMMVVDEAVNRDTGTR